MSGQNVSIRLTLERIRSAIRQMVLKESASSGGKSMGDPKHQAFWDKLGLYESDLRRILKQLHGRLVSLENQRPLLWRIPREHRYSARQSLDDREAATLDLVELAELTLRELLNFSGDAATMKIGDWEKLGEKLGDFAEYLDKALVHTTVQQLQKGPAFTTGAGHPGLGLDHLGPLIGLIIAVIASKRRKST